MKDIDSNTECEICVFGRGIIWILKEPDNDIHLSDSVMSRFGTGIITGIEGARNMETGEMMNMGLVVRKLVKFPEV